MKTHSSPWKELSTAARRRWPAPLPAGEPPLGFHARVLARLPQTQTVSLELWWRMSLRALPVAAAIMLFCWFLLPTGDVEPDLAELVMEAALP